LLFERQRAAQAAQAGDGLEGWRLEIVQAANATRDRAGDAMRSEQDEALREQGRRHFLRVGVACGRRNLAETDTTLAVAAHLIAVGDDRAVDARHAVDIAEVLHGGQYHVDVGLRFQVLQGIDVIGLTGILATSERRNRIGDDRSLRR
jgi:hypothetical protein